MAWAPERMVVSLLDLETTREGADFGEKNRILDLDMLPFYIILILCVLTFDLWSLWSVFCCSGLFLHLFTAVCDVCFSVVFEHMCSFIWNVHAFVFMALFMLHLTMLLPYSLFCLMLTLWSFLSLVCCCILDFLIELKQSGLEIIARLDFYF